jgi:hypothetical protein
MKKYTLKNIRAELQHLFGDYGGKVWCPLYGPLEFVNIDIPEQSTVGKLFKTIMAARRLWCLATAQDQQAWDEINDDPDYAYFLDPLEEDDSPEFTRRAREIFHLNYYLHQYALRGQDEDDITTVGTEEISQTIRYGCHNAYRDGKGALIPHTIEPDAIPDAAILAICAIAEAHHALVAMVDIDESDTSPYVLLLLSTAEYLTEEARDNLNKSYVRDLEEDLQLAESELQTSNAAIEVAEKETAAAGVVLEQARQALEQANATAAAAESERQASEAALEAAEKEKAAAVKQAELAIEQANSAAASATAAEVKLQAFPQTFREAKRGKDIYENLAKGRKEYQKKRFEEKAFLDPIIEELWRKYNKVKRLNTKIAKEIIGDHPEMAVLKLHPLRKYVGDVIKKLSL